MPVLREEPPPRKVYLAGPDVFLPNAIEIGMRKKALCREFRFEGLFPFDNELEHLPSVFETAKAIYQGNLRMMQEADFIIAHLTPFRGCSADVGTAFEMGIVAGMGKLTIGYTNDPTDLLSRVVNADPNAAKDEQSGRWFDSDGLLIEDFRLFDNLMLACSLENSGFPIVRPIRPVPPSQRYSNLEGFKICLDIAHRHFSAENGG